MVADSRIMRLRVGSAALPDGFTDRVSEPQGASGRLLRITACCCMLAVSDDDKVKTDPPIYGLAKRVVSVERLGEGITRD